MNAFSVPPNYVA